MGTDDTNRRKGHLIPPPSTWTGLEKFMMVLGGVGALGLTGLFWFAGYPGTGALVSLFLYLLWFLVVFVVDGGGASYGDYSSPSGSSDDYSVTFDSDMTKDYVGKHGEFDRYDESRRVSEDIQQFHNCHPGADLSDHYYWDDVLDADTDGYLDD